MPHLDWLVASGAKQAVGSGGAGTEASAVVCMVVKKVGSMEAAKAAVAKAVEQTALASTVVAQMAVAEVAAV
jgi:hypothetical protein